MLAVAFLIVAFGMVAVLPDALRFRRRSLQTNQLLELYRQAINLEMAELAELSAERDVLLHPFQRARRVLTHPLTVALFESYRLRRRRKAAL